MNLTEKHQHLLSINNAAIRCCSTLETPYILKNKTSIKFFVSGREFLEFWRLVKAYVLVSVRNFRRSNPKIRARIAEEDMEADIMEICYRRFVTKGPGRYFSIEFPYMVQNYFYTLISRELKAPTNKTIYFCKGNIDFNHIAEEYAHANDYSLTENFTDDVDFWNSVPEEFLSIVKKIVLDGEKLGSVAKQENMSSYNLYKKLIKGLGEAGVLTTSTRRSQKAWKLRFSASSISQKSKIKLEDFTKNNNMSGSKVIDLIIKPDRNLLEILKKLDINPRYFYNHAYRLESENALNTLPRDFGVWYRADDGGWERLLIK